MIQGTSSSVGKSVMAAALCRILAQDGVKVAPFKAQNMSNNSYVTADGGEMGRAQVVQAQAAGIEPHTDMNPVLLKPEADSRSQVVINGKPVGSFEAQKYWGDQSEAWKAVTEAYDRLAAQYDVIVLEGAGSPAEVNLRDRDIANMKMAAYANASVIIVGDVDRGGVFASLLGTMELLLPEERALVKATLINRFRGDINLLKPLPEMIAERTGVPVAGVIPFVYDLQVKDEDGVTFGDYDPPAALLPTTGGGREAEISDAERSRPTTSPTNADFPSEVIEAEGSGAGSRTPDSSSLRETARLRGNDHSATNEPNLDECHPEALEGRQSGEIHSPANHPEPRRRVAEVQQSQTINIAVMALPRVSNHDDLDPFRRAGCLIRIVTNPSELATAHIIIIPGSKSTIADIRWMKSRGLDKAIIEAAKRNVTIVGICGGYQILGEQLDDPHATESSEPQSEPGLGLLPTSTVFDTQKTTRRVTVEIPAHETGPLKGEQAHGTGYEIHTGITTGTLNHLATLTDDTTRVPSNAEGPRGKEVKTRLETLNDHAEPTDFPSATEGSGAGSRAPDSSSLRETARTRGNDDSATNDQLPPAARPDGTIASTAPIIGTYVHGIFDSPEILRRLLNATAETHNLPQPIIEEFSMEAEYDRLAKITRENLDMPLINSLIN